MIKKVYNRLKVSVVHFKGQKPLKIKFMNFL